MAGLFFLFSPVTPALLRASRLGNFGIVVQGLRTGTVPVPVRCEYYYDTSTSTSIDSMVPDSAIAEELQIKSPLIGLFPWITKLRPINSELCIPPYSGVPTASYKYYQYAWNDAQG